MTNGSTKLAQFGGRHLVEPRLGLRETIDRRLAESSREQMVATLKARQAFQDRNHFVGEWNDVRRVGLHALGWNYPLLFNKIKFAPSRLRHLPLALSGEQQHSEQRAIGIRHRFGRSPQGA